MKLDNEVLHHCKALITWTIAARSEISSQPSGMRFHPGYNTISFTWPGKISARAEFQPGPEILARFDKPG